MWLSQLSTNNKYLSLLKMTKHDIYIKRRTIFLQSMLLPSIICLKMYFKSSSVCADQRFCTFNDYFAVNKKCMQRSIITFLLHYLVFLKHWFLHQELALKYNCC